MSDGSKMVEIFTDGVVVEQGKFVMLPWIED